MSESDLLSLGAAARALGYSHQWTRELVRTGALPAAKLPNGHHVVLAADVQRLKESRQRPRQAQDDAHA